MAISSRVRREGLFRWFAVCDLPDFPGVSEVEGPFWRRGLAEAKRAEMAQAQSYVAKYRKVREFMYGC